MRGLKTLNYKTLYKPWGKEIWLELNDRYCYKRIHINAGKRTSYQYHKQKLETNYIIEGTAEVWLENDQGIVEKKVMEAGEFFTVEPPRKHRVVAITDIILQEVSTPEVDDVFRISDDSNRGPGRINHEHMKPAICILAAGVGSRLSSLSEHINKGLLPLNNKAIISHLIDKVSEDYDIVIVLGHKGEMVKEYCNSAHPDKNFTFVTVDSYEGDGTGPGYSIKQAEQHLQRPFIWATADTIITDDLPSLDHNWLGLHPTSMPERYSTVRVKNEDVTGFTNKSKEGYDYAFIGLAGVYDYKTFWEQMSGSEIVSAYHDFDKYSTLKGYKLGWYDIGTVENYLHAQKIFDNDIKYSIPKTNGEFLYKVGNNFIKLSSDKTFISGRIERAKQLGEIVPKVVYYGESLFSYQWIEGDTLYDCNDIDIWTKFLAFMKDKMWTPSDKNLKEDCLIFYRDKTLNRLKLFLSEREDSYSKNHTVNGVETKDIKSLLHEVDWDSLSNGLPTKMFHGDLQFDNVIYTNRGEFYLLDWRQDFAGQAIGDVYYDLAKMYGGILMSYKFMKNSSNFSCSIDKEVVTYDYKSEPNLDKFKLVYENWLVANSFDLEKIKTITSLIFLNMSPLHERTFGDLLFFKSKQMLQKLYE
jgi:choline kinase/mannose-6-phosphate isomerase-like protein (cupin superfamily)